MSARTAVRIFLPTLVITVALLAIGGTLVQAQNPMMLRWDKAAPFPEPEEELYGVEAGGKMYVIGGFSENGKPAPAMVYEYDPTADLAANTSYTAQLTSAIKDAANNALAPLSWSFTTGAAGGGATDPAIYTKAPRTVVTSP